MAAIDFTLRQYVFFCRHFSVSLLGRVARGMKPHMARLTLALKRQAA